MANDIRILIMDDDLTIQKVVSSFLDRYFQNTDVKYHIEICDEAMDCVFDLHDHGDRYDIILLDFLIPGVDGVGVYNSVLYSHPELIKRIVFLTGSASELKSELSDANILEKPFEYDSFHQRISNILLQNNAIEPQSLS